MLSTVLDIPALPSRLMHDCERELTERIQLAPGDVEELSLARARTRWPNYRTYLQTVTEWTQTLGLAALLSNSQIALMACRGARYHHDAEQYGNKAFCNLFLSDDKGLDLHFPFADKRMPLQRGTAVIFDTAQPHAVICRDNTEFHAEHFPSERECSLLFLTWELPLENDLLAQALGIMFNAPTQHGLLVNGQTVELEGRPVRLCPVTGKWQAL